MNIKKYFVTIGTACAALAVLPSLAFASFDASLGYGASGTAVMELQNFLISEKCLSVSATGYFGSLTTAAVKCFQEKSGITPTGYFGVISRTSANSLTVNGGAYTPVAASSSVQYAGTQIQSSVNLSQGALAPASITPLAGYGNSYLPPASTSPYSLSPLVGDGQIGSATTSMSQGADAPPPLSPLINNGSN